VEEDPYMTQEEYDGLESTVEAVALPGPSLEAVAILYDEGVRQTWDAQWTPKGEGFSSFPWRFPHVEGETLEERDARRDRNKERPSIERIPANEKWNFANREKKIWDQLVKGKGKGTGDETRDEDVGEGGASASASSSASSSGQGGARGSADRKRSRTRSK
jgi:hypothetical protein